MSKQKTTQPRQQSTEPPIIVRAEAAPPDPSRLTDDECDFIIQRALWALSTQTEPIAFFRQMGRGVVFEVKEEDKERARSLVRLFAHGEAA